MGLPRLSNFSGGSFKHVDVDLGYSDLQVREDNGRKYETPDGSKYPSMTTVLSHLGKDGLEAWRARVGDKEANKVGKQAANRGTTVHNLMEAYINGEEISTRGMMPHHLKSLKSMSKILDENLEEVWAQEAALYSHHLGVAGRVDLVGVWKGVPAIIDFKTSRKVKKKEWIDSYFMQTAGYAICFEERTGLPIPNLVILMDIDNHDPVVFLEHRDNWVGPLKDAIKEYHRLERCKA